MQEQPEAAPEQTTNNTVNEAVDAVTSMDPNTMLEFLKSNGIDSSLFVNFGKDLIVALLIFYIGRFIVKLVVRGLTRVMDRQQVDTTLQTFVGNLVRVALMVVVIIAAIGAIGIQTTSFIAIFGAAGLAVGLALQGSLSNFAAGVLIVLFRPYKVGDYVEAAGIAGSVEQVQILTTVLKTPDNKQIIVPNSQIMDSIITNYSA
ncbi:MAG: mechanosensitive ion channel, partial [Woeseiaceae bacterium]|nr:mechanosensitive ion channel [Woeseiaceae bacterium]